MKRLNILIVIIILIKLSYAQQMENSSYISLFKQALRSNPIKFVDDYKKDFSVLDDSIQFLLLDYLYSYEEDSLLYLNINKLHQLLEIFYSSNNIQIRKRATNLILETYRLTQGNTSVGWVWYKNAKFSDFDQDAKSKIIRIIKCEPFSEVEKNLLYLYELDLARRSYNSDTLRIRKYKKKTILPLNELRDSLATEVAKDNIKSIKPSRYLEGLGMYYLASWLYVKEALPYIEEAMKNDNLEMKQYYKLPLARMGNQEYENELLDSMRKINFYDYHILGFLRTTRALDAIIQSLKVKGRPKGKITVPNKEGELVEIEIEGEPFGCYYLRGLIKSNLISTIPFVFDDLSLALCEISDSDILKVVEWLEQNRNSLVLNYDYH